MAENSLEIISLRYQTAEQLMPVLRPYLEPGGVLNGMGSQLIVKTSPANLAELRKLLDTLDAKPRRLLILVRQDVVQDENRDSSRLSGRIAVGEQGRVQLPGGRQNPSGLVVERTVRGETLRGEISSTYTKSSSGDVQQVQALEGRPALIQVGQSVPLAERQVYQTPYGPRVVDTTSYRNVTSGFYVTARLSANQVMLDLSQGRDTLGSQGQINVQHIASTLSGRLGEWIEVGGFVRDSSRQDGGWVFSTGHGSIDQRRVWIKVEEMP
jgi:hypothetical protein